MYVLAGGNIKQFMVLHVLDAALGISILTMLPLAFGVALLFLFLLYVLLFAWLSIIPIFKGHFRIMCNVWCFGLYIVAKTWKLATIGAVLSIVFSIIL